MDKKNLERKFKFTSNGKDVYLEDPDPKMDLESIRILYSGKHPELVNSKVNKTPKLSEDGKHLLYEFGTKVGTKG